MPRDWQDFQFIDPERGWAAGESGALIATQDGGRTWHWQLTPLNEELSLVRFADRNRGWAFARGTRKVLSTQDGGRTWETAGEIPLGNALSFFERAVQRLWTTSSGTLVASGDTRGSAVSEDGGHTWRVLAMPSIMAVGRSGALWGRDAQGLWVSRDTGRTASVSLPCQYPCYVVTLDLAEDSRLSVLSLAAQNDGSVTFTRHASTDGGTTWSAAPIAEPHATATSNFSPIGPIVEQQVWGMSHEPGVVVPGAATSAPSTASLAALWHSADAGSTWTRVLLPTVKLDAYSSPVPLDGTSLWIAANNVGYVTLDGGLSWRAIEIPGEQNAPWFMRRSGSILLAGFGMRWYSSADGGALWTALPAGQRDDATALHWAVWFGDARHGLSLATDGAISATNDGGLSWQQTSSASAASGFARWYYPGTHFTPDGVIWVRVGEQLLRSRDEGRTWQSAALPQRIAAQVFWMQFLDASHGWARSSACADPAVSPCWGTLYRTSDGGQSWDLVTTPGQTATVAFSDSQTGVLMRHDASMFRTEDGGQSWTPVVVDSGKLPFTHFIYFRTPQVGWILPATDHRIMKTVDGGRSWILAGVLPETGASGLHIQFADEDHGWIVGERGLVLHTDDGGASWQRQDSGTERTLLNVFPIDTHTAWIAGGAGTLLYTRSGGGSE